MLSFATCCFLFLFMAAVRGDIVSSPFVPPSQPLAVRSPYLSTWLQQADGGTALNDDWPRFWAGQVSLITMLLNQWKVEDGFNRSLDGPVSFV